MRSVAPESMTNVEEDERKHVLVLPNVFKGKSVTRGVFVFVSVEA